MSAYQTDLYHYLSQLYPLWQQKSPLLLDYFEHRVFETGEFVDVYPGDLYIVNKGTVGKYYKKTPKRYILRHELIMVPSERSGFNFKALESCHLWMLSQQKLHDILSRYPQSHVLQQLLLSKQQQSLDFRTQLLELPKADRLSFFRKQYSTVIPLISRTELAQFLHISGEYLRRLF
ncbi:cyclic nucleotide-binding domain-containing protein [Sphingobacterium sp. SYP-B4668]|uniref:cyclic nucleotide-binding domain-containing protein n=1 Tax=Sphingobacterium sp. SYP-B4668 TaxID=2996035 RepID=UPI0022DE1FF4|nr:cyclic nucleotide-binding domain-containing protein [Sphingobacterium sp. SYP-B4668]